jgi:hypothetical protein
MNILKGQFKAVKSILTNVMEKDCNVICEAGNDNGEKFNGEFLVKIFNKDYYRFDNMQLIKIINH